MRWLNVTDRVLSPGFLVFNWSARFGTFLQVSALASHWMEDCANFTPTPAGEKRPIKRQPLLMQHKQHVNSLFSMHNNTLLVNSENDNLCALQFFR